MGAHGAKPQTEVWAAEIWSWQTAIDQAAGEGATSKAERVERADAHDGTVRVIKGAEGEAPATEKEILRVEEENLSHGENCRRKEQ